jgi:hypothetical protein
MTLPKGTDLGKAMKISVGRDENKNIFISFIEPVDYITMSEKDAADFAMTILKNLGYELKPEQ